ncbi:hypothetical protein LZ30DRAFT_736885 [Colletotrichum cereale]|nr:hypothetical protein LZ30DRAFT_736885 [Colletotrichum cereale]
MPGCMMAQSHNHTPCSSPTSQEVKSELASYKSQLEKNLEDRENALIDFNNRISDLIQNHREFCQDIQRRQQELIAQAFGSTLSAHEVLGNSDQYELSDGSQFMLQTEDLVIGFMPASTKAVGHSKESTTGDNQIPTSGFEDNDNSEPRNTPSMVGLEMREIGEEKRTFRRPKHVLV